MSNADFWKNREKADALIKELGELNDVVKRFGEIEKLLRELEKSFSKTAVDSPQRGESPFGSRPRSSDAPSAVGDYARSASETSSQKISQSPLVNNRKKEDTSKSSRSKQHPDNADSIDSCLEEVVGMMRKFEIEELMKGKYDKQAAVITISAGAGGQDAEDWAGMLYGMYTLFSRRRGWKTSLIHESLSDFQSKTGRRPVKSVTFEIRGTYAYGFLKHESGVHRLVRISPFSPEKKRHTSFALVEVLPDFETIDHEITIPESDLKVDFFRSSGPGGQNVNKVETAVRVTHIPTGIVVASQEERSQSRNRERAVKLLIAKLVKLMEEQRISEVSNLRTRVKPEWGSQIRSYVLHPYKLVKDHRTTIETSQAERVLEGDLDIFIESEVQ